MKKGHYFLLLGLLLGCQDNNVEPDNTPNLTELTAAQTQITESINDFSFQLLEKVDDDPSQNPFLSPLSVSMALAMVLNGATDETASSILKAINFSDLTPAEVNEAYKGLIAQLLNMDKKIELGVANSVWHDKNYQVFSSFSTTLQDNYDARTEGLDFKDPAVKDVINGWVESKTNNRIKDLIENVSPDEFMFLVNAIYFKGDWTYQFDKSLTKDAPFKAASGESVNVKTMISRGVKLKYHVNADLLFLDIPYGNEQFSFTVIQPMRHDRFDEIIHTLNAESLRALTETASDGSVELQMPKFKITWKNDLKGILKQMGMHSTGFDKLVENVPPSKIEISRVIHQTFLEVNESGAEAAAATAVGMQVLSAGPNPGPSRFIIDRPFVFMIREKHTGAALFIGKLADPRTLPTP